MFSGVSSRYLANGGNVDISQQKQNVEMIVKTIISNMPPTIVKIQDIQLGIETKNKVMNANVI